MKALLFILFTLGFIHMAQAQEFVREKDPKTGKPILRGKMSFRDIQDETTNAWFYKGASAYEPKDEAIRTLRGVSAPYRFVVFLGTWCEDTQDLLPKFYKMLNQANIDLNAVELYGVDRNKESLNLEHVFYNVKKVPTFIVMHQHREVGRLIESVNLSIEEDLAAMMEKDFRDLERKRAAMRVNQ